MVAAVVVIVAVVTVMPCSSYVLITSSVIYSLFESDLVVTEIGVNEVSVVGAVIVGDRVTTSN